MRAAAHSMRGGEARWQARHARATLREIVEGPRALRSEHDGRSSPSMQAVRRILQSRHWWLIPLALLLIPAALIWFFVWNTPDWANFEYRIF
jgi:hypothetical protein